MKKQLLKNWEISLLLALCITLCAGTWAGARSEALSAGLIRLHIVAASDEAAEQELKLRVRDSVLAYLEPRLQGTQSAAEAAERIEDELDGIRAAAEAAAEGREAAVTLGREYYPTRDYGSFALPAGRYESLRVVLGEGEGHNWWCVLFPALCLPAAQDSAALGDVLSAGELDVVQGGYEVKFKAVELYEQLRGWMENW